MDSLPKTAEANLLLRKFMLALCVYREASGESDLGRRLVAQTIKNRVIDKRWPDDYVGVITQKLQFSSFNPSDPNASRWPRENEKAWIECIAVAEAILDSPTPITSANHYHTKDVNPPWADKTKIVISEGHHVFYNL